MPLRAPRPCTAPRCPALVRGRYSRCDTHRREGYREYEQRRPDRERKAFYGSAAWKQARAVALKATGGRCVMCDLPASDVDHIHPVREGGDPLSQDNLRPLCRGHHSQATALASRFGRKASA